MFARLFACALILAMSCDRRSPASTAELRLAMQQPSDTASSATPASSRLLPSGCLTPGVIRLRGALRREVHFGPPGYGENPETDERDTIIALILRSPLRLWPDSASGERRPAAISDRRITLWHVTESALDAIGKTVTVYGFLHEASFAHEFGPLVMQVDSIPDLRPLPPWPSS
jgi:hypothetical protein